SNGGTNRDPRTNHARLGEPLKALRQCTADTRPGLLRTLLSAVQGPADRLVQLAGVSSDREVGHAKFSRHARGPPLVFSSAAQTRHQATPPSHPSAATTTSRHTRTCPSAASHPDAQSGPVRDAPSNHRACAATRTAETAT